MMFQKMDQETLQAATPLTAASELGPQQEKKKCPGTFFSIIFLFFKVMARKHLYAQGCFKRESRSVKCCIVHQMSGIIASLILA